MQLSITNSDFVAGNLIQSSQIDQNFADIIDWANGNISNDNFDTFTGEVSWAVVSNALAVNITNTGDQGSIAIAHSGVLAATKAALSVASSGAQTTGAALLDLTQSHASSSIPMLRLLNGGTGDYWKAVTSTANYSRLSSTGILSYVGSPTPGWMSNLAIVAATTTDANDSVKITGADGTALSVTNPGYITLPSTTAGRLATFRLTSDVTIQLSGATAGFEGADITGVRWFILAINDGGAIKWGVSIKGDRSSVVDTSCTTTHASVDTPSEVLVNTPIDAGTWPIQIVGSLLANFTDTGDVWAIDTASGSICLGARVPSFTPVPAEKTAAHRVRPEETFIRCDATSGALTVTLHAASLTPGKEVGVKKTDSSANAITVTDGSITTYLDVEDEMVWLVSDGTAWEISDRYAPLELTASGSSGSQTTASTAEVDLTNNEVEVVVREGEKVFLALQSSGTSLSELASGISSGSETGFIIRFYRDASAISVQRCRATVLNTLGLPASAFWFIDEPSAGTYTYKATFDLQAGSSTNGVMTNVKLVALKLCAP